MNKTVLVQINKLKAHEETDPARLRNITKKIIKSGMIKNPIIVERRYMIILDGHHRVSALKSTNVKKAPVFFVDYLDPKIRVVSRRPVLLNTNIKAAVIKTALANKLFPSKTTKHFIAGRPTNINIRISKLY
jgi:hypothetical protein